MKELPLAARLYVGAVLAGGAIVLAVFAPRAFANPLLFAVLLVCSSVASALKVNLPLAGAGSTMSVSYAVDFASLLLLGADPTLFVAALSAWSQCTFRTKARAEVYRTLFSMASLVLTVKAAGLVYLWLGGAPTSAAFEPASLPKPLVGAATTYFLCNTALIATAIALSTRQRFSRVWNENFLWSAPSYFVGAGAAAIATWVIDRGGYWMALLLAAPLYLTYRTYRVYMGRVQDQERHVQEVSDLHLATIEALALAIDAKDQTAQSHIRRVQVYAAGIARALGMSENEIQGVKTAALLHDIGKLAVPEHILSKPGPLTQEEFQKIRIHPQVGAEIISGVPFPYPVAPLILSHHERWDGKGYPIGLKGDEIPLGARILSVVDYFDALLSERPYHKAMHFDAAIGLLGPGKRKGARPARRTDVHRNVSGALRRSRCDTAGASADTRRLAGARSRTGSGPGQRGGRSGRTLDRVPGHRARAPRDLRPVRDRAGDGQQPGRLRYDGADLIEVEQHRPVLVLRAVPVQRRDRDAALSLRVGSRSRADSAARHQERPRPDWLGGAEPSSARQRAAERRPGSGREAGRAHAAPLGARLPACVQRALHRDDLRVPLERRRVQRRPPAAARPDFRAGRRGHLQLDDLRADPGRLADRPAHRPAEHAVHVHASHARAGARRSPEVRESRCS